MYHHGVDPVTAFVLAGGKSSRMGRDKAFLQAGGEILLARALKLARATTENVGIVGCPGKFSSLGPVIEDIYADRGPLGGIHAALTQSSTDLNLMLAVDLPFLEPDFLHYLISEAQRTVAAVVVPSASGGLQPLCAVYRRSFAPVAERSLMAGKNKIDPLFTEVRTRVIGWGELEQNGFAEDMFHNLNTPEEWQEAVARFSANTSSRG